MYDLKSSNLAYTSYLTWNQTLPFCLSYISRSYDLVIFSSFLSFSSHFWLSIMTYSNQIWHTLPHEQWILHCGIVLWPWPTFNPGPIPLPFFIWIFNSFIVHVLMRHHLPQNSSFSHVWQKPSISQQAHDVNTTSPQRRCNVMTLHRRWGDVIFTSCARWDVSYCPWKYAVDTH